MTYEQKTNLVIGASSLVNPLTGIGQYTLNLARELSANDKLDIEYFYSYYWSRTLKVDDSIAAGKVKSWIRKYIPYSYKIRRHIQQKAFSSHDLGRIELYHEPNFLPFKFEGKTVITLHDLSFIRHPQSHPIERVRMMNELIPKALRQA